MTSQQFPILRQRCSPIKTLWRKVILRHVVVFLTKK